VRSKVCAALDRRDVWLRCDVRAVGEINHADVEEASARQELGQGLSREYARGRLVRARPRPRGSACCPVTKQ
jgi:hypothetical protein